MVGFQGCFEWDLRNKLKSSCLHIIAWLISPVVNIHLKFKIDWIHLLWHALLLIGTMAWSGPSLPSSRKPFLTILFNTILHIHFPQTLFWPYSTHISHLFLASISGTGCNCTRAEIWLWCWSLTCRCLQKYRRVLGAPQTRVEWTGASLSM